MTKHLAIILLFLSWLIICSCTSQSSRPSIFLVANKKAGFTSIQDLRHLPDTGRQGAYLAQMMRQAEKDLMLPYIDPSTPFDGRSEIQRKHQNVSYDMAIGLRNRFARSAILFLRTGDKKYKALIFDQIKALNDTTLWPMWCDHAHVNTPPNVDIRTCRISMWAALIYDWLYDAWSEQERKLIVDMIDRRAIQPFWQKIAQNPGWKRHRHNWFTNIYGGMGITAMALGNHHPETQALLDTIVPAMIDFNAVFGEMGEFNEPPGYAGAVRFSVEFAEAYRYYTDNQRNLLREHPFPEVCYWMLYHTIPPQRIVGFGDTPVDGPPRGSDVFAAVANANQDGILQWYYQQNFRQLDSPIELLWYNPKLEPVSPEGILPLGKAYEAHGASLISRTSWDPQSTACVVYGKAGRETNHDDNDVGQLLIDGFGERLIIDSGKPDPIYPSDYFRSPDQYNYYSRSSTGHNVLVIDGQEMKSEPNMEARGKTIKSSFDDDIGSSWKINLSPVYYNASRVTRSVIHLFPGIVLVHDEAEMPMQSDINLRWHTITPPNMANGGSFSVRNKKAGISAKVVSLDGKPLEFTVDHQAYNPPYNLTRQGDPLVQDYEPFVKISTKGASCSILSLFAVMENVEQIPSWEQTDNGWKISINGIDYEVSNTEEGFVVAKSDDPSRKIVMN